MFKKLSKLRSQVRMNRTLMYLTFADVSSWGTYDIALSLSGIYLATRLGEDVVQFVGIGVAIYFVTRGIFQIPIGLISDALKKYTDEALILMVGLSLMGFTFICYPLIESTTTYFLLQFIFGLGSAMDLNAWRKLFARNLEKDHEGLDYAIYETIMSFSTAVMSLVAGSLANLNQHYFDLTMILIGMVIMSGAIWPIMVYRKEQKSSKN